jgi:hypothetical protein
MIKGDSFVLDMIRIRIRILGSIPLIRIWMRIRLRILLFRRWLSRCKPNIIFFSNFLCLFFFEVTIASFFKDKMHSHKTVKMYSSFFCLLMEKNEPRSGSVEIIYGSGCGSRRTQTTDPDPQGIPNTGSLSRFGGAVSFISWHRLFYYIEIAIIHTTYVCFIRKFFFEEPHFKSTWENYEKVSYFALLIYSFFVSYSHIK